MNALRRARLADPLLQLPVLVVAVLVVGAWDPLLLPVVVVGFVLAWPPAVPWRPVGAGRAARSYALFVVPWLLFAFGYLHLMASVGHAVDPQDKLLRFAADGFGWDGAWSWAVAIVVVAPLVEEILFRGYLFTALATLMPMWATQLVTALLFGLAHGPGHALPIGVLSLLFGYLRQRHGSLLPGMLAHALHNALTLLLVVSWPPLLDLLYGR